MPDISSPSRLLTASVTLSVALLVAGCSQDEAPEPTGSSTAAASSSATSEPRATASLTPSPSPTASVTSATDRETVDPETGEWLISSQGVGPFAVGVALEDYIDEDDPDADDTRDQLTRCPYVSANDLDRGVWVNLADTGDDDNVVDLVDVSLGQDSPVVATTREGIGFGASPDAVRAAYPDATRTTDSILDHPDDYNLVVALDGTPVAFQIGGHSGVVDRVVVGSDTIPWEYCG